MKLYVKPQIGLIEIRPEERLAWTYTTSEYVIPDLLVAHVHSDGTDKPGEYEGLVGKNSVWLDVNTFVNSLLKGFPGFK